MNWPYVILTALKILTINKVLSQNLIKSLVTLSQNNSQFVFGQIAFSNMSNSSANSQKNLSDAGGILCPVSCRCYIQTTAQCTRIGLTRIPCDIQINNRRNITYQKVFSQHLQDVYLSYNRIREIPDNCFAASGRNIETLSLQQNVIANIAANAFQNLNRLRVLDLSHNRLTALLRKNQTRSAFGYLAESLESLFLSHNRVENIPERSFSGFRSLRVLSLSQNKIRWISRKAFADLTAMKVLQLRGNPLTSTAVSRVSLNLMWFSSRFFELSPDHGVFMINISTVLACSSPSEHSNARLKRRNELVQRVLNDSYHLNSNTSIHYYRKEKESLMNLDLGELQLTHVPQGLSRTLNVLFLDRNRISVIRRFDFSEMHELQHLYLSHNQIQNITENTFASLRDLRTLDLSSNNLHHLDPASFCGLFALYSLRLYNNSQLTRLPNKVLF